jgi:predicted alpha-1,6-mannanase (GH76 family)
MRAVLFVLTACGASHDAVTGDAAVDTAGDAAVDAPSADIALWHERADQALEAMLLGYWNASYLDGAAYWTFAQAYDAALDGIERTGRYTGWAETLYLAQDAHGWSSNYYDDENWMALALIRAYDLAHDAKYLAQAKALFADIMAAWDTTCCGAHPGGIWWDRAHTQKATASNAGPVITGVRLAARTGATSYRDFARQVYTYWRANMVDPTTFEVFDHIAPGGAIAKYKFTYNEGLMIGAAQALDELADAHAVAGRMLAAETKGGILDDGTNTGCTGDCQQFKGIGYRYLQALHDASPKPAYAAVLDASAQAIWGRARSPATRFAPDWAGPPVTAPTIDADSSAVMAVNLHARSLGPAAPPPARYDAEDGVLHALGLEASHAGFDGWGYVAGWHTDGQWVDFHVHTQGAGHLVLHYAAGAGNASRLIYVDGANAIANQAFASTGSWDTWSTLTVPLALAAGDHAISVIFNSGLGSANYINLDWIELAP